MYLQDMLDLTYQTDYAYDIDNADSADSQASADSANSADNDLYIRFSLSPASVLH